MDTLSNIDAQLLAFPRPWSSAHLTAVGTGTALFVLPAEDAAHGPAQPPPVKPVAARGDTLQALAILQCELEQRIGAAELNRPQALLVACGLPQGAGQ
ncbi:MAG TPA: hypothetical protein VFS21_11725 [Roseiflexaceae bacterium]|nr:hypothetical protein [Roseiflexaceae bacterium]